MGDHGLLAGDGGQVADHGIQDLGVLTGLAAADVDHDLLQAGDLHGGLIAELLHQSRSDLVLIQLLQVGRVSHFDSLLLSQISAPHFLQTRTFLPSASSL